MAPDPAGARQIYDFGYYPSQLQALSGEMAKLGNGTNLHSGSKLRVCPRRDPFVPTLRLTVQSRALRLTRGQASTAQSKERSGANA